MSLEIHRGKNPKFYGRFEVNGKTICPRLKTKVEGRVPKRLSEQGDTKFEVSRAKAQMEHDAIKATILEKRREEELLQKILRSPNGEGFAYRHSAQDVRELEKSDLLQERSLD